MSKISIVLPINIQNDNQFNFFYHVVLKSYEKYINANDIATFFVICPALQYYKLQPILNNHSLPFQIIQDEYLINGVFPNWYKQQLLKLLICKYITTKSYLILDSDMFLVQQLNYNENDDDFNHFEIFQTENSKYYSQNSNWWKNSCSLLNYDYKLLENKMLLSVTPQMLNTNYVRECIHYLNDNVINWQQQFCDLGCTEFTIYYVFLLKQNLIQFTENKHSFPIWKHSLEHNILHPENYNENIIDNAFLQPISYFCVVQSYLNYNNYDQLIEKILKYLNREKVNIVLTSSMLKPNKTGFFSVQERFEQTIQTATSVKRFLNNNTSIIHILIEGSILTNDEKIELQKYYDIILEFGLDEEVQFAVNNSINIGIGECMLLKKGVEFIKNHLMEKYDVQKIFKLGARYCLTNEFNYDEFEYHKYTFYKTFDESINSNVYTTGLFNIPINDIDTFIKMMEASPDLFKNGYVGMVEYLYYKLIPLTKVKNVNTLGLEGRLSYHGKYFKK